MVYDLAVYDLPIRAFLISTIRNGTEKFILAQEKHFNFYIIAQEINFKMA